MEKELKIGNPAEFNGVFYFTNPTTEDFVCLWNSKEYKFPAEGCYPLIIPNESAENIQEIRKKWAYKLAVREFYKGTIYKKLVKEGGNMPALFDEKLLEPVIESCLKPLPIKEVEVKEAKKTNVSLRASKAFDGAISADTLSKDFADEI